MLARQFLIALYIADEYKGYKNLWFLWKMDARWRVYTVGPPLSFQGPKLPSYLFQIAEDSNVTAALASQAS